MGVFLEREQGSHLCRLQVAHLQLEDEGAWRCQLGQEQRFVFLAVVGVKGPELLVEEGARLEVEEGGAVSLVCPSTARPASHGERPVCSWVSPRGGNIDIVGRCHASTYIFLRRRHLISSFQY